MITDKAALKIQMKKYKKNIKKYLTKKKTYGKII